jgi:hypothetical protein
MTSPRVIELPRRLEPVARDTFLGGIDVDGARAVAHLATVVALRPRDALGLRRPPVAPQPPTAA